MGNAYFNLKYCRQDKAEEVIKKLRRKLSDIRQLIFTKRAADITLVHDLMRQGMSGRALLMLRRKRFIENELVSTSAAVHELEELVEADYIEVKTEIISRIRSVKTNIDQFYTIVMIPHIDQLLDTTDVGQRKRNQLTNMLKGLLNRFDEKDVADELIDYMDDKFKPCPGDDFFMREVDILLKLFGASSY